MSAGLTHRAQGSSLKAGPLCLRSRPVCRPGPALGCDWPAWALSQVRLTGRGRSCAQPAGDTGRRTRPPPRAAASAPPPRVSPCVTWAPQDPAPLQPLGRALSVEKASLRPHSLPKGRLSGLRRRVTPTSSAGVRGESPSGHTCPPSAQMRLSCDPADRSSRWELGEGLSPHVCLSGFAFGKTEAWERGIPGAELGPGPNSPPGLQASTCPPCTPSPL